MKNKGFTLVELAVTLVTLFILMSISVPIYRANIEKFKQAEAYALLASIRSAQEAYYAEYGQFLCSAYSSAGDGTIPNGSYYSCEETILGINARTNKYYTYFCVSGYTVGFNPHNHSRDAFNAIVKDEKGNPLRMYYDLRSGVTIY